MCDTTPFKLIP